MNQPLTIDDARQSLNAHLAAKGDELHAKYGPHIGWAELQRILADRACVRYPCEIQFDAAPLLAGEFAQPIAKGARPEDGFTIFVHPAYAGRLEEVSWLVLYQLVAVNYGWFAGPDDAETFGSHALGLAKEDYYEGVCRLADQVGAAESNYPIRAGSCA